MKGMVFNEFLEMVEAKFGYEMVDRLIESSDLPSGAAYTSVGTYDYGEMMTLVGKLAEATDTPVPDLVKVFGQHLFGRFAQGHPHFFEGIESAYDFLKRVDSYVHVEVRKLHPDAELPTFDCHDIDNDGLEMVYQSSRPFGDLAEGLIRGCIEHYGEPITLQRDDLGSDGGSHIRFTMRRAA